MGTFAEIALLVGAGRKASRQIAAVHLADWRGLSIMEAMRWNSQLRHEMAPIHPLQGRVFAAIARHIKTDDVAYLCTSGEVGVVHLGWKRESMDNWPNSHFFESLDSFLSASQAGENGQHVPSLPCPLCQSDWGQGDFGPSCPCCDGHALSRPCPQCQGLCDAVWQRAIIDSQDSNTGIWLGKCKQSGV